MKKKNLEIILQQIPHHPDPRPHLEQYPTPSFIATDILYLAQSLNDIQNKKILDLGCGCGIFAIGAKLLGAKEVIGMDMDEKAIEIAREYAQNVNVDVEFQVSEIMDFNEKGDTVLQNPPFGAQKLHADRPFLEKALTISNVTYSLHLSKTREFIKMLSNKLKSEITHTKQYYFDIKHTFDFHTKEHKHFDVTMFRFAQNRGMT
jgi:putative methylase